MYPPPLSQTKVLYKSELIIEPEPEPYKLLGPSDPSTIGSSRHFILRQDGDPVNWEDIDSEPDNPQSTLPPTTSATESKATLRSQV